jgi:outer membrane receptor for ferrienterochelin and colicins
MFINKYATISKLLVVVLPLCLVSIGSEVFAEQQEPNQEPNQQQNLFEMSLEELMDIEVYTASRYKQNIHRAPASVTIMTADDIRLYGYRTLADILQSVRGFFVFNDRNYTFLGVRGTGPATDFYNRVLVLIDGHRISENVSGQTPFSYDFPLDVALIERVEIVRGPASSLYGADAMFGVVNVITKNGKDYKGAEVAGSIASYQTQKERLTYGNIFANGWDVLVSASNYGSEGHQLYYREFDDPATNNGKVDNDGEKARDFFAKMTLGDWGLTAANVAREKKIPTASYGQVFNDDRGQTLDRITLVGLTYNHEFSDEFSVAGKTTYHQYDYDGEYPTDYADYVADPVASPDVLVNKDMWKGQWWQSELLFTAQPCEKHKITWGGEFRYNVNEHQKNWDTVVHLDDNRHPRNWGVYAQDEYSIIDNLILNAGVRYDEYQTVGSAINPRIGLIYNYSDKTALKLLYGQAFRAPTAYERYYSYVDYQKSNPTLGPETIKTYEVVLEHDLDKDTKITVAGFYYRLEDLIATEIDDDDVCIFQNEDGVSGRGAEFEMEKKWQNGIRGRASYSYVQTELLDTHEIMTNSPEHLAKVNLIVPVIKEKLFAGIETQYTGETKTYHGGYIGGFGVTNLTLTYQNLIKNLEVSFGVYNLFDKKYAYSGSGDHVQDSIEQDGRTFFVRLQFKF